MIASLNHILFIARQYDESLITSFILSNLELFGFKKNKEKTDTVVKEKPIDSGEIEYVGGHKAFPSSGGTKIFFYDDRIELGPKQEKTLIKIPYSNIIDIENLDEKKFAAERAIMLGLIGALWKKKHIYTVIHYKDELDQQKVILDFEDNVEYAQRLIYNKMLEARKKEKDRDSKET